MAKRMLNLAGRVRALEGSLPIRKAHPTTAAVLAKLGLPPESKAADLAAATGLTLQELRHELEAIAMGGNT